jgi:lipopolysaccharide export system permease protein
LYAVAVLGVVLVLGNLFKQIQPLLVDQKAPLGLLFRFVLNVLPLSLMYTIPWGFLSAVLLVFGKLSSTHEITGFRIAGLGLGRLSAPVFVLGALLSAASLWLNVNVVPFARASAKELIYDQAARDPASLLKPGIVQGDLEGDGEQIQKLLVEGNDGKWLTGFHLYVLPADARAGAKPQYIHATHAALAVNRERRQLSLKLEDAYIEWFDEKGAIQSAVAGRAEPLLFDLKGNGLKKTKANSMSNAELREQIAGNPDLDDSKRAKLRNELQSRYSFSMACLAFSFIAVPLGLQTRRRDTSRGFVLSLAIGTGYFLMTMLADQFDKVAWGTVMLWAPNAICVILGLVLFRRARFR